MQYKLVKSTNLLGIYIVINMTIAGKRFGKHVPVTTATQQVLSVVTDRVGKKPCKE
jgi:hypothetical protein